MVENDKHRELIEKAKKFLISEGFVENEIFREYQIYKNQKEPYLSDSYYVDIVGKNEDRFVLIECGSIEFEKIDFLRNAGELYVLQKNSSTPFKVDKNYVFPKELYEKKKNKAVCISITSDQYDFITHQRRTFVLSKFVQGKLDDYMKSLSEIKRFTEAENEKKVK